MVRYMKCPRCGLNYIDAEKQTYCDICVREMKGIRTDADELEEEEAVELATELCPVCGENMMRSGEKMCEDCYRRAEMGDGQTSEEDDEWREYLDDDTDAMDEEIEDIGETFDEDEIEEEEEPEEEYHDEDDDLDYVTGDEIYTLSDDEDDEEDDEEDF